MNRNHRVFNWLTLLSVTGVVFLLSRLSRDKTAQVPDRIVVELSSGHSDVAGSITPAVNKEDETPKRKTLTEKVVSFRVFCIEVIAVVLLITLVGGVGVQVWRNQELKRQITVGSFSVRADLQRQGFTSDRITNGIANGINDVNRLAATGIERTSASAGEIELSRLPDVEVASTKFSLANLIDYFTKDTSTFSGELTEGNGVMILTVHGPGLDGSPFSFKLKKNLVTSSRKKEGGAKPEAVVGKRALKRGKTSKTPPTKPVPPKTIPREEAVSYLCRQAADKIMERRFPYLFGMAHFWQDSVDYSASLGAVREMLSNSDPDDDAKAYNLWGITLWATLPVGKKSDDELIEQTLEKFDKAIAKNKNFAYAYYNRGRILDDYKKDLKSARTDFQCALKKDPNLWEAKRALGVVYEKMALLNKDPQCLKEAMKWDDDVLGKRFDVKTICNLGEVKRHSGDWDGARRCYKDALSLDPNAARAYFGLGELQLAKHGVNRHAIAQAITYFKKSHSLDPTVPPAFKASPDLYDDSAEFLEMLRLPATGKREMRLREREMRILQFQKYDRIKGKDKPCEFLNI